MSADQRDYDGVNVTTYGDSFRDGLAFMALVDKYTDGVSVGRRARRRVRVHKARRRQQEINYEDYKDDEPQNRLQVKKNAPPEIDRSSRRR